jgi:hypothetical protein
MKKPFMTIFFITSSVTSFAVEEVIKKEDLGYFIPGGEHQLVLSKDGDIFRANLFLAAPIKLKLRQTRPFHHVMTFYVCHQFNQMADVLSYEINTRVVGSASVNFKCKDGYSTKWRKKAGAFCAEAKDHMVKTCELVTAKFGANVFK